MAIHNKKKTKTNKHLKRYSTLLLIREMQTKTVTYHYKLAKHTVHTVTIYLGEDNRNKEFSYKRMKICTTSEGTNHLILYRGDATWCAIHSNATCTMLEVHKTSTTILESNLAIFKKFKIQGTHAYDHSITRCFPS